MTRIFLETAKRTTSEYVFVKTILDTLELDGYEIITVGGKDNLGNLANKFMENTLEGGRNIIVFDADTEATQGGFLNTKERILDTATSKGLKIDDIFLFPNNHDDGIFENLLEQLILKDKHSKFLDCFSDYEKCLGDDYIAPNIKGKVYEYITIQKEVSGKERNAIGKGEWLFDNPKYWNLDAEYLTPLKEFFKRNLS